MLHVLIVRILGQQYVTDKNNINAGSGSFTYVRALERRYSNDALYSRKEEEVVPFSVILQEEKLVVKKYTLD